MQAAAWDVEGPEHPAASPPQSVRALPENYRRGSSEWRNATPVGLRLAMGADAADRPRRQNWAMARFSTTLQTTAPASPVLDHLADFATVAVWDPGVTEAALISGDPGQVGSRYRVVATFGPRRIPLEYVVVEREDSHEARAGRVVLSAETGSFTSHDTITVTPTAGGCQVQYDAILTLHGPGRVMDWPLNQAFQVIGRRAQEGLRAELAAMAAAHGPRPQ